MKVDIDNLIEFLEKLQGSDEDFELYVKSLFEEVEKTSTPEKAKKLKALILKIKPLQSNSVVNSIVIPQRKLKDISRIEDRNLSKMYKDGIISHINDFCRDKTSIENVRSAVHFWIKHEQQTVIDLIAEAIAGELNLPLFKTKPLEEQHLEKLTSLVQERAAVVFIPGLATNIYAKLREIKTEGVIISHINRAWYFVVA